jgi:uncharacterized protein YmfQ (DUF2313 family)
MALTADDYLSLAQSLLPNGPAWSRQPDSVTTKILAAWSEEFARIEQRIDRLLEEADPRTTSEMLADWERNFSLPDGCLDVGASPEERRRRLTQKVVWQGGQSIPFFIDLVETLGYPGATITEFRPFQANSKCNAAINQNGWRFAWRVNVPVAATVRVMNATSPCNSPLRKWGDASLLCILSVYKPAHTILFVAYTGDY